MPRIHDLNACSTEPIGRADPSRQADLALQSQPRGHDGPGLVGADGCIIGASDPTATRDTGAGAGAGAAADAGAVADAGAAAYAGATALPPCGHATPPLISARAAAELFGRTCRTLRNWEARGWLTPVRIGRGLFYRLADIEDLIQRGARSSETSSPGIEAGASAEQRVTERSLNAPDDDLGFGAADEAL